MINHFSFTPVYLILRIAFVSNNRDTINSCPCLTKRPLFRVTVGVLWGNKKRGQSEVRDFLLKRPLLYSICTYFCPALILNQKTAFHTHSALKLLLKGKEALKGLNPGADGGRPGWGRIDRTYRGEEAKSKEVEVRRVPEVVQRLENMSLIKCEGGSEFCHQIAIFVYLSYFSFYTHCLLFAFFIDNSKYFPGR